MEKNEVFQREHEKLSKIFEDVDENIKNLVEGLIQDASFLFSENVKLRDVMLQTGMVKVHPNNPGLQKTTEAGKQYLKNVNSYATVIKTLNGILGNNAIEEDDPFDQWLKEQEEKQKATREGLEHDQCSS